MDQWIIRPSQLIFDQIMNAMVDLPGHWQAVFIFGVLLIPAISTMVFATVVMRLSHKQRSIKIRLADLKAEIDQLRQAEERRMLVELRSSEAFLQEMPLQLVESSSTAPETADRPTREVGSIHPVRLKLPAIG